MQHNPAAASSCLSSSGGGSGRAAASAELARRRKQHHQQHRRVILVPFTPLDSFVRVTLVSLDSTARFLGRSAKFILLAWLLGTAPRLATGAIGGPRRRPRRSAAGRCRCGSGAPSHF